ncbi:hypothetical protein ES707_09458 [subsurface metagenome]
MDQRLLEIERKSLIIRKAFETSKLIEKYPPKIKSTNLKFLKILLKSMVFNLL